MKKCTPQGSRTLKALPQEGLWKIKVAIFKEYPQHWRQPAKFEKVWRKWHTSIEQFSTVTVSQNCSIPVTSSCFDVGFTSLRKNSLSTCHRFSIGFRSGLSGGVCHQLIRFCSKNSHARLEVCLGSLSCMKRWWSGYTSRRKGMSGFSKMVTYT